MRFDRRHNNERIEVKSDLMSKGGLSSCNRDFKIFKDVIFLSGSNEGLRG